MDFSWTMILYQMVNFIILMVILGYIFNKFIRPMMKKRTSDIETAFAEIEKQKSAALDLKEDLEAKVEAIKINARNELQKATMEGIRIKEDFKREAEKETATFMEKARKEIEQEKQKLISEVRREVAMLTMLATKQLIKKEVDSVTNEQLVEKFLAELGTIDTKKN